MELAEESGPQSTELAMCPPHAITAVVLVAVKYTLISFELSPVLSPDGVYPVGFAVMAQG